MKKIVFFVTFVIGSSIFLFGQSPSWQWAKSINGPGNKTIANTAIDKNGNCYISGRFQGQIIQVGNITLSNLNSSVSNPNIYLAKFDSSGNALWARNFAPGSSNDMVIDKNMNIYITGPSGDSLVFDTIVLTGHNSSCGYIAKFDSSGNAIWVRWIKPGTGLSNCSGPNLISTDPSGNLYCFGHYCNSIIIENDTLFSNGFDIFLAKFNSSGNLLWARTSYNAGYGGSSYYFNFFNSGMACDKNGNSYISGRLQNDTVRFGNLLVSHNPCYAYGFIAKYDSSGNEVWVKGFNKFTEISKIIVSGNSSDIYFSGNLNAASFSGIPFIKFGNDSLPIQIFGGWDIINGKIDSSGNLIWVRTAGGPGLEWGNGICSDILGNLFVTGWDTSSISFGNIILNNTMVPQENAFIAKYDTSGNVLWALGAGGPGGEGYCVNIDSTGDLICSGLFGSSSLNFGSHTILHYSGSGFSDIFISKLGNSITGINFKKEKEYDFIIYPNPNTGNFSIKLPKETNYVMVSNSLGQVLEKRIVKNQKEIGFNIKENGVYFVKVVCDKGIINKKVVVSK